DLGSRNGRAVLAEARHHEDARRAADDDGRGAGGGVLSGRRIQRSRVRGRTAGRAAGKRDRDGEEEMANGETHALPYQDSFCGALLKKLRGSAVVRFQVSLDAAGFGGVVRAVPLGTEPVVGGMLLCVRNRIEGNGVPARKPVAAMRVAALTLF